MRRTDLILLLCLLGLPAPAAAQRLGDQIIEIGAIYIGPNESSTPLRNTLQPGLGGLLGIEDRFDSPGTGLKVDPEIALGLIYSWQFSTHFGLRLEGGLPPRFALSGQGRIAATGPGGALINLDLDDPQFNPLASARQWSPVLQLTWLPSVDGPVQPAFGIGGTYTFFTDIRIDPEFRDAVNARFGTPLAVANARLLPTSTRATASSDWGFAFSAGLSTFFSEHWGLAAGLAYVPLKITTEFRVLDAAGGELARSSAELDLDSLIGSVLLRYRF